VPESKPSKSARKREQLELQRLGESLITLSDSQLASFALDERLREAIRAARSMRANEALRRQKQFIGKLMRDVDPLPIRQRLALLRGEDLQEKRVFADAEQWRDRLVSERSDALDAFEAATGCDDSGLGELLAELDVVHHEKAEKTLRREIFRRVHEILVKIAR